MLFQIDQQICQSTKYMEVFLQHTHEKNLRNLSLFPTFIFYGLPGTGKTSAANLIYEDLKNRHNIDKYLLRFHDFSSSNFGESSKNIAEYFGKIKEEIHKNNSIAYIFADELDSFTTSRTSNHNDAISRILLTFNQCIDEVITSSLAYKIILVATSNNQKAIDPSVLRRFCFHINFDIRLTKELLGKFIYQLTKEKITDEILLEIYNIYKRKEFTLGEIKRICAINFIENITSKNTVNITPNLFENTLSAYELNHQQGKRNGNR